MALRAQKHDVLLGAAFQRFPVNQVMPLKKVNA